MKNTTMNKLNNKVAIITGANSGIGLATAKEFLNEGAKVVLSGRRKEALEKATQELEGDFITVVADVAKDEDNINLIKTAVEKYGKIDILYLKDQ
jgi:NADP-dependent 3-hydroxy acid dehydrogenase YdfG